VIVGLLHPGAMGSAIGNALAAAGHDVVWASEGRSAATTARAERMRDVRTVGELAGESVDGARVPEAARALARRVAPAF